MIKNILQRSLPIHRVIIGLIATVVVFLFIRNYNFRLPALLITLWDTFAFCYVLTTWIIIAKQNSDKLKLHVKEEDGSRMFVFAIIIAASVISMVIVLLNVISKDTERQHIYILVSIIGMLLSWFIVHTTFALHYAHLYYGYTKDDDKTVYAEGLNFPEEKNPDLLDFAYFSFGVGMTFQVSDVAITSKLIRRTALFHTMLAFYLNTFVIALTVNLIAEL